ncbi:hypothetical protein OPV22_020742 [Ensete ventricosum]|uniref:Uncharacterized protein n=1 Tax=Ensete ventricosum TaxID=4639 RepID=A0AAV8QH50_ENSVE|nr:hypothetical protein OPV22_020742 [Ensete ventricosum]
MRGREDGDYGGQEKAVSCRRATHHRPARISMTTDGLSIRQPGLESYHFKLDGIRPSLSLFWFCSLAGRSDNGDGIVGAVHRATVPDSAAYEAPVVRQALRFDEWKDPSEEALAGGRGMFCILPIAKSLLNVASLSISLAADFVIKALKSPNQLSRQELHANLCGQFHKLALNMQGWNRGKITESCEKTLGFQGSA